MAGIIIVTDSNESSLNLPREYGIDDFPLVIQTKAFDTTKQIILGTTQADSFIMVNATLNAYLDVPEQYVRFRVLNGASQRVFNLGLSDNGIFYQIASDGGLLNTPVSMNRLLLALGERAELLINFSGYLGDSLLLMSYASEIQKGIYGAMNEGATPMQIIPTYSDNPLNGNDFEIMKFYITNSTASAISSIPLVLNNLVPFLEADMDEFRHFQLNFTTSGATNAVMGPFDINGESFDMSVINEIIKLHDIEVWEIFNHSGIAHPFHIHNVQFFLIDRTMGGVPDNERGRKDVVLVKSNETIKFITKFEDFYDDEIPYMYHCHMLSHEDEGMMGQFIVEYQEKDTTSSITLNTKKDEISIYPNPIIINTILNIESDNEPIETLKIYDNLGGLIYYSKPNKTKFSINTKKLKKGILNLQITTNCTIVNKTILLKE